jgi:hypothetical protein
MFCTPSSSRPRPLPDGRALKSQQPSSHPIHTTQKGIPQAENPHGPSSPETKGPVSQVPGHVEEPHNGRRLHQNDGPIANPPSSLLRGRPNRLWRPNPLQAGAVAYPNNDRPHSTRRGTTHWFWNEAGGPHSNPSRFVLTVRSSLRDEHPPYVSCVLWLDPEGESRPLRAIVMSSSWRCGFFVFVFFGERERESEPCVVWLDDGTLRLRGGRGSQSFPGRMA